MKFVQIDNVKFKLPNKTKTIIVNIQQIIYMEWVNLNVNDSGAFKITFTGLDPMYLEFDSKEEAVKSFESILKSANK